MRDASEILRREDRSMRSRVTKVAAGLWQPLLAAAIIVGVIGFIVVTNPSVLSTALPDLSSKLDGLSGDPLAAEKIRREVVQLELANRLAGSFWASVVAIAPALTAALGIVGLFVAVRREQSERNERANKERAERDAEHQRQANESFRTTVQNLSADPVALRASAAVSLGTFLRQEYADYRDDVILVALAKAKKGMESDRVVRRLVVRALETGLRLRLADIPEEQRRYFIDFYDCDLGRIDLSGLDLHDADLGHAIMSHAILDGANLRRSQGIEVVLDNARIGGKANLSEARLQGADLTEAKLHDLIAVSIRLERATLVKAEFYRAQLQEAHFAKADLSGAMFQGADINNAFFETATLDEPALRSIAKGAKNWQKAHFDRADRLFLDDVVAQAGRGRAAGDEAPPGNEDGPDGTTDTNTPEA